MLSQKREQVSEDLPMAPERALEERLGVCKPEEPSPSNANQLQGAGSQSKPLQVGGREHLPRST